MSWFSASVAPDSEAPGLNAPDSGTPMATVDLGEGTSIGSPSPETDDLDDIPSPVSGSDTGSDDLPPLVYGAPNESEPAPANESESAPASAEALPLFNMSLANNIAVHTLFGMATFGPIAPPVLSIEDAFASFYGIDGRPDLSQWALVGSELKSSSTDPAVGDGIKKQLDEIVHRFLISCSNQSYDRPSAEAIIAGFYLGFSESLPVGRAPHRTGGDKGDPFWYDMGRALAARSLNATRAAARAARQ